MKTENGRKEGARAHPLALSFRIATPPPPTRAVIRQLPFTASVKRSSPPPPPPPLSCARACVLCVYPARNRALVFVCSCLRVRACVHCEKFRRSACFVPCARVLAGPFTTAVTTVPPRFAGQFPCRYLFIFWFFFSLPSSSKVCFLFCV